MLSQLPVHPSGGRSGAPELGPRHPHGCSPTLTGRRGSPAGSIPGFPQQFQIFNRGAMIKLENNSWSCCLRGGTPSKGTPGHLHPHSRGAGRSGVLQPSPRQLSLSAPVPWLPPQAPVQRVSSSRSLASGLELHTEL